MIQRKQSIYLLIAVLISAGLTTCCSLWANNQVNTPVYIIDLFSGASFLEKATPVLFFISALLSAVTLFLFKNRELQFVLGRVNILINFFLLGILIYLSQTLSGEAAVSEKGIGMFFPILVILLLVLANKAIKKDEDLVKSVDRLR
ncbi:DUF4293 domain-containing protein [Tenacibaculum finnmarkense]|uniref:Transcription termination factor Rho n=1 Tax=Tenacibaculum finnmarkense genomovar ulcerans TaxID=2781388 RepID=A0A2I2M8X6_9FLAO|nr:DUF4293 domain-containing protein [Tenacibaculum finnmarkense]ALU74228.1 hypothetical protein AUW17_02630 [Tenacibaculum dicentrarchi]MBE7634882.1 DUF4293 family protein [Tenacibaculum finnmarkense genomovar ulcerans]MBE7648508.1 DUF4293 family protein [Tenacibaculum finnmarkense genomovar ulcerans]MBE7698290.1 DUF4293 family protein [Tenacibaculum finnmarkense genomovar ulcerans]MCD8401205.1 DUF4293 domain-containing protein [Tenacibaculum finnmarkense genomovar ulcerans]